MSIILASGSPRRKELLEMLGVKDMKIIPANGEEVAPAGLTPGELVMALAAHKGREVAGHCAAGSGGRNIRQTTICLHIFLHYIMLKP